MMFVLGLCGGVGLMCLVDLVLDIRQDRSKQDHIEELEASIAEYHTLHDPWRP